MGALLTSIKLSKVSEVEFVLGVAESIGWGVDSVVVAEDYSDNGITFGLDYGSEMGSYD